MKREELARTLEACTTRAHLLDQVEALLQRERREVLNQALQMLERRDPGYNRVVNRLMALRKEK